MGRSLLRLALAVILAGVLIGGCSTNRGKPVEFFSEVVSVERGTDWSVESSGGPWSLGYRFSEGWMHLGPMTIELANGTTLDVPPETPGGNQCSHFVDEPTPTVQLPERCSVAGKTSRHDGSVEWFQVMLIESNGLIDMWDFESHHDGWVRTGMGFQLPLSETAEFRDDMGRALDSIEGFLEDCADGPTRTWANPEGEIARISCLAYDG